MKRGSIWWVEFDPVIGSEIKKTRPAVIVSNDVANCFLSRVIVIPLTGNTSKVYTGEAVVKIGATYSKAVADQIRAVDKLRLKSRIGTLSVPDMEMINDIIRLHLNL
ncbi:MAG: type II toxin-antitoxin system PemK/MazF family toxin [Candidatus Adiutrix sp.]|jgi:mRNA interferase MazF|nr:type II toxin-antitoxin system PemK/MazF family toxin [Candidatus Adiutrix sp.]